jgi:hypothetical protein
MPIDIDKPIRAAFQSQAFQLDPFKAHGILHIVTNDVALHEAVSLSLNTRSFRPIILRREYRRVVRFYVLRELGRRETEDTYWPMKGDRLYTVTSLTQSVAPTVT